MRKCHYNGHIRIELKNIVHGTVSQSHAKITKYNTTTESSAHFSSPAVMKS